VVKLTPNDLTTLMNVIHPLPIIKGMGFNFQQEKYPSFQVFSREKSFIALYFKVLLFPKLFQLFLSLLNLFN